MDWTAGTPGKIPVGRAARVGDILAAKATCTLQKAHQVQERSVTLLILESECNEILNTCSELQAARIGLRVH